MSWYIHVCGWNLYCINKIFRRSINNKITDEVLELSYDRRLFTDNHMKYLYNIDSENTYIFHFFFEQKNCMIFYLVLLYVSKLTIRRRVCASWRNVQDFNSKCLSRIIVIHWDQTRRFKELMELFKPCMYRKNQCYNLEYNCYETLSVTMLLITLYCLFSLGVLWLIEKAI